MKMLSLYWSLLRYRVAVMIVLFMLLGAAWHGGLASIDAPVLLMILALASSYVSATSVNDISDREIDEINHPDDRGRPLVTGAAGTADLWALFGPSSALAVLLALPAGPGAAGIMLLSVVIGVLYSLPPARLSYRTFLAPLTLAFAYVGIPYWAGVVAAGGRLGVLDLPLMISLYLLFAARIILKDFRDREGDAAFGKPTFLLEYGKKTTCLASLCAVCAGDALLVATLAGNWWPAVLLHEHSGWSREDAKEIRGCSGEDDDQDDANGGYVTGERDPETSGSENPRKVGYTEREQDKNPCTIYQVLGTGEEGYREAENGAYRTESQKPGRGVTPRSDKEPVEQERYGNENQGISSDPGSEERLRHRIYQGQQEDQGHQRRRANKRVSESSCGEISQDVPYPLYPMTARSGWRRKPTKVSV